MILAGIVLSGCSSTPTGTPFASVVLTGVTPTEIRDATIDVFRGDGWKATQVSLYKMTFEKQSTKWNNLVYGDWSTTPLWYRVNVSMVGVTVGTWRLECEAFRVLDRARSTEETKKVSGSGPYQKLLDEVAVKLGVKTPPK